MKPPRSKPIRGWIVLVNGVPVSRIYERKSDALWWATVAVCAKCEVRQFDMVPVKRKVKS